MLKRADTAIALMMLCFCPSAAVAAGQKCMAGQYRVKSPACVDDVPTQLRLLATNSRVEPNTVIGFLAELFRPLGKSGNGFSKMPTSGTA